VAERDQLTAELQALAESKSEHVHSILSLDDQLAREQQLRTEATQLLQQTQQALAERSAKEAELTKRAQQADKALAAYKVSGQGVSTSMPSHFHVAVPITAPRLVFFGR